MPPEISREIQIIGELPGKKIYNAGGKFPFSRRFFLIGPRKREIANLITTSRYKDGYYSWSALIASSENDDKRIHINKNRLGCKFTSKEELLNFLRRRFKINYMRDPNLPAVNIGD